MLLKTLRMENIRSYDNACIDFPQGSILLAGDIGSGKSTILHAIEFSLFGLKLGELSGSDLLRHGKNHGSVELSLEVDKNEITVKRTLRRVKDKIGQGPGYIIINGTKQDLMPKEIRAKVYELLNYPSSLLSKNHDLIYRYTIYTPQEHMKRIISENREIRLDTLRKVFSIDKYKRIRENASLYSRQLRDSASRMEGIISDLDKRTGEMAEAEKKLNLLSIKKNSISSVVAEKAMVVSSARERLAVHEESIRHLMECKKEIAVLEAELSSLLRKKEDCNKDSVRLEAQISALREELKSYDATSVSGNLNAKDMEKRSIERFIAELRETKSLLLGRVEQIGGQAKKVKDISECPLCLQSVPHEHKSSIIASAEESITSIRKEVSRLEQEEGTAKARLIIASEEYRILLEKDSIGRALKIKKQVADEKKASMNKLLKDSESCGIRIDEISRKKVDLSTRIENLSGAEKEYLSEKSSFNFLLTEEKKLEISLAECSKELEGVSSYYEAINKEVAEKQIIREQLISIASLRNFLETGFSKLVDSIEKHVFMVAYNEFNFCFQNWFSLLLEDGSIASRLDDSFSVIIEQNGYDASVDGLSGGEKTCVALAYRLSLNKAINDIMSGIRTKGLIILDEPTEGFSSEQLDRVRNVLNELNMKQTIIVSHEEKVEGFVDSVIRVRRGPSGCSEIERKTI
ncbi:SMC family ATPase [Candidatus Woesearchaeota archaeon]|nr:SMC family ATPase [Candidatus Woesearchaeota archaeon]